MRKQPEMIAITNNTFVTENLETGKPVFLDGNDPEHSLNQWLANIAFPSDTIERFATYEQLSATAHIPGEDDYITLLSQPRNESGYTYLNGIVCQPEIGSIMAGIGKAKRALGKPSLLNRGFAEEQLARLASQELAHVVVGRFGRSVEPYGIHDRVLRRVNR